jgi:hypothetical protein
MHIPPTHLRLAKAVLMGVAAMVLPLAPGHAASADAVSMTPASFDLRDIGDPTAELSHVAPATAPLAQDEAGPDAAPEPLPAPDLASSQRLVPEMRKRGWTKGLTRMELAFQALNLVDMAQTLECRSRSTCVEKNPILGKRPSKLALVGFTAGTGLLHYALVRRVAHGDTDTAKTVSVITIGLFGAVVGLNFKELM